MKNICTNCNGAKKIEQIDQAEADKIYNRLEDRGGRNDSSTNWKIAQSEATSYVSCPSCNGTGFESIKN